MADVNNNIELTAAGGSRLVSGNPADDALMRLLAHMVVSDGVIHPGELDFLSQVMPNMSQPQLESWAREHGGGQLDVDALAESIRDPDSQWKSLRFAARMAWKDGELAEEERMLLENLANAMDMPGGAVDRVLAEMAPDDGNRFTAERILKCLVEIHWDSVQLASGDLVSDDLKAVLPPGHEVVARVGVDRVEVLALCTGGILGRFQEGAAFLTWGEIVTYTRSFGLGASVLLHTEDGRSYALVDSRMSGLAMALDRMLGDDERRSAGALPNIKHVRGDED